MVLPVSTMWWPGMSSSSLASAAQQRPSLFVVRSDLILPRPDVDNIVLERSPVTATPVRPNITLRPPRGEFTSWGGSWTGKIVNWIREPKESLLKEIGRVVAIVFMMCFGLFIFAIDAIRYVAFRAGNPPTPAFSTSSDVSSPVVLTPTREEPLPDTTREEPLPDEEPASAPSQSVVLVPHLILRKPVVLAPNLILPRIAEQQGPREEVVDDGVSTSPRIREPLTPSSWPSPRSPTEAEEEAQLARRQADYKRIEAELIEATNLTRRLLSSAPARWARVPARVPAGSVVSRDVSASTSPRGHVSLSPRSPTEAEEKMRLAEILKFAIQCAASSSRVVTAEPLSIGPSLQLPNLTGQGSVISRSRSSNPVLNTPSLSKSAASLK